jgi:predicted cupin superfamily sugar epimerase
MSSAPVLVFILKQLQLSKHPEGGYYKRTFTSSQKHPNEDPLGSSILFLIGPTDLGAIVILFLI